jgi:hypothetical protein
MADMKVSIGLRWQPGSDIVEAAGAQILCDGFADEVGGFTGCVFFRSHFSAL